MFKVVDQYGIGSETKVVEVAAKKLGITDAEITIVCNNKFLDKFGGDSWIVDGLLYKTKMPGNDYILYMRSDGETPLRTILCHEMLHLKQYIDGDLLLDEKTNMFVWKGRPFRKDYPYMKRPWEQEVFRVQNKFLADIRKAVDGHKCSLFNIFKRK